MIMILAIIILSLSLSVATGDSISIIHVKDLIISTIDEGPYLILGQFKLGLPSGGSPVVYNTSYFKAPEEQLNVIAAAGDCNCKSKMRKRTLKLLRQCITTLNNYLQQKYVFAKANMDFSDRTVFCTCVDEVNEELKQSLERCRYAISVLRNCKTKKPHSCLEIRKRNPQSVSGYYTLVVNYKQYIIYCYFGKLC